MQTANVSGLAFVIALGGCLGASIETTLPDILAPSSVWSGDFLAPFVANHSHNDATTHGMALRMRQLAHHPLAGNSITSSQAHVVDVKQDWLFVGTQGPQVGVSGGLWIFDVKDPEAPALVGRLPLFGNLGGDRSMEATEDAAFVVLGTEAIACGMQIHPWGPGFYLIDVRDKTQPRIVDYIPDQGVHSLVIHRIDGEDYVFSAAYTTNVLRIEREGLRPTLVVAGSLESGHDGVIRDDPVLGVPLFYTAQFNRLAVYDVSNPGAPQLVGSWTPEDTSELQRHYSHMVEVFWHGDRRIIAYEQENWMDEPSPIWFLDATDLGAMERVTTWSNPAGMPANGLQRAAHVQHAQPRVRARRPLRRALPRRIMDARRVTRRGRNGHAADRLLPPRRDERRLPTAKRRRRLPQARPLLQLPPRQRAERLRP
jgi:hypothetical protein